MARIFDIKVNGRSFRVEVEEISGAPMSSPVAPAPRPNVPASGPGVVTAPMASTVSRVLVQAGQPVAAGDKLFMLEAMKMETPLIAPAAGTVLELLVKAGDRVEVGQTLARIG